jgi:DNA-binding transcriptional MerR regulator
MENYLTCGQVARKLHVSISTLKRWACEPGLKMNELRNHNGWRLFSEEQVHVLKEFKRRLKRNGKRFNQETLLPINAVMNEAVFEKSHSAN